MPVEIHVACRKNPSSVAMLFQSCRVAQIEIQPARTIRAWSPRAHSTLLIRDREIAAVVTLHCHGPAELGREYAELIARAFEGVVVIDGEVVDLAQHDLGATELTAAWSFIHTQVGQVLDERDRDRQRKRQAWELTRRPPHADAGEYGERDGSSI